MSTGLLWDPVSIKLWLAKCSKIWTMTVYTRKKSMMYDVCRSYVNTYQNTNLVGGFNPLKNISQVGLLIPIIKVMSQTTNQIILMINVDLELFIINLQPTSFDRNRGSTLILPAMGSRNPLPSFTGDGKLCLRSVRQTQFDQRVGYLHFRKPLLNPIT
jgi:hypothetical protein